MSTPRLSPDARVVELRAALTEIIGETYSDTVDVDCIRDMALAALATDDELRERMAREGTAPLPPGGRLG